MGSTVSSGRDNDELIDNLIDSDLIITKQTENVFRAVDRGNYMLPNHRKVAYQDSAWRAENIHLSAPSIYCKVVESLELKHGVSFLNLGGGTGYLNTMVGLIIGSSSSNHAIEYHPSVVEYAIKRLDEFILTCPSFDEFDFCMPQFVQGNALKISAVTSNKYDRVYCGADCPKDSLDYIKNLLTVGGIAIVPCDSQLTKITRTEEDKYTEKGVLPVSFAELIAPTEDDEMVDLPEFEVHSLKTSCRKKIRALLRNNIHIYKGELDVRRRKGPSAHPPSHGFTQTMTRYLSRLHTVEGDNIHVIRVPEPGDGELRGLLVPVGADAPHAPDRQMVPHDDIYADSDDDAHTQRPGIAAVVTSRPIDTPSSRPIATPSSVSVTAERSLSEGADSGLGTSASSSTPTDRMAVASSQPAVIVTEPLSEEFSSPNTASESQQLLSEGQATVQDDDIRVEIRPTPAARNHSSSPITEGPSTSDSCSPKRRLEEEGDSSGDEKRPSFCGCCFSRQSSASASGSAAAVTVTPPSAACNCTTAASQDNEENREPPREPSRELLRELPRELPRPHPRHHHNDTDSSSDESDDNVRLDDDGDMEARFLRRRQVLRSLMSVLDERSDQMSSPTKEEDEERLHNRNKANRYHSDFCYEMNSRVDSLPLPPLLKDYLLYYRNRRHDSEEMDEG